MSSPGEYSDTAPLTYSKAAASAPPSEPPPPAYAAPMPSQQFNQYQQHQPQMAPPPPQPPTIVYVQPVAGVLPQQTIGIGRYGIPLDEWQVGICDGCHDCGNWLMSCFCPCLLACKAVQRLDENPFFPFACGVYPLNVRFRTLVGIKQSMCEEALLFCVCPTCSTLRLVNEMDERGFNMQRS